MDDPEGWTVGGPHPSVGGDLHNMARSYSTRPSKSSGSPDSDSAPWSDGAPDEPVSKDRQAAVVEPQAAAGSSGDDAVKVRPLSGQFGRVDLARDVARLDVAPADGEEQDLQCLTPTKNRRGDSTDGYQVDDVEGGEHSDGSEPFTATSPDGSNGVTITYSGAAQLHSPQHAAPPTASSVGAFESVSLTPAFNGYARPAGITNAGPSLRGSSVVVVRSDDSSSSPSPRNSAASASSSTSVEGKQSPSQPQSPAHSDRVAQHAIASSDSVSQSSAKSSNMSNSPESPENPSTGQTTKAGLAAVAAIRGGGGLGVKNGKISTLEKVMSRTRQSNLPPKPRQEDKRHLKEFEEMMAASAEMQKKRSQVEHERKLAREAMLASFQPTWEKEVLPNWKVVLRDDPLGKSLRQMWWNGTMPIRHRGRLWHQCIGNAGAVGRSAFQKSVALANSLITSNPSRFPRPILEAIDDDIARTLTSLKLFQEGRPLYSDLKDMLLAWSVFWREKPFYPVGSSFMAALFLINLSPQDAFLALVNLVRKSCLSYFYNNKMEEMDAYYRIFDTLLADTMPKVYRNFQERRIRPGVYLFDWLTTAYAFHLPFELATRVMDVFVLEGDSFLFRVALALLQTLEIRLFNPDADELTLVFRGEDRGTRAIVGRLVGKEPEHVAVDEVYKEMGCEEEFLFQVLGKQTWNEGLWERLVSRELPDF